MTEQNCFPGTHCTCWSHSSLSPPQGRWCSTRARGRRLDYGSNYRPSSYQDTWKWTRARCNSMLTRGRSSPSITTARSSDRARTDLLLRLVNVLVRILLVPALTLSAADRVVHLTPVVLPITADADLCKPTHRTEQNRLVTAEEGRKYIYQRFFSHFSVIITKETRVQLQLEIWKKKSKCK